MCFFKKNYCLTLSLILKLNFFFTFILASYALFTVTWGAGDGQRVAYQHIIWFLESFFISVFFVTFFQDVLQKITWEKSIILVGLVASLITVFLILNPSVNEFIRSSVIIDSLEQQEGTDWDFRGFSISDGAAFSYGVIQGLILAFCFFRLKDSLWYFAPIFLLFISIIFNARIGIAPVAISLILLLFSKQLKIRIFLIIAVIVITGNWFFNNSSFSQENEKSLEWGLSIFEDTFNFIQGEDDSSNYSVLTDDMSFLPNKSIHIIFGEGRSVFGIAEKSSDIGYVNQIFMGGIMYLGIMLIFLWYLYRKCRENSTNRIFVMLFVLTILVANIKGDAFFMPNGFTRLFIFYYVYQMK